MVDSKLDPPPPYTESPSDPAVLVFRTPTSLLDAPGAHDTFSSLEDSAPAHDAGTVVFLPPRPWELPDMNPLPLAAPSPPVPPECHKGTAIDSKTIAAVFSGSNQTYKGKVIPKQITAYAAFGGVDVDLRGGTLQPGVTEIWCYSMMGGVSIRVAGNMDVEVDGYAVMGGFSDGRQNDTVSKLMEGARAIVSRVVGDLDSPQPPGAKVVVKGFVTFGGASVVNR
ncbi:hypothetical protein M427DRAFT_59325 [Gonapodya prolifera JEL478]|uniref:Uncharacterized protein n=1 Tax=Gonapodya prolifera (strain JEL478) TaxID=1344416 RepID=A0A139A871_GONPJ|nr:hypothetical protein M427DRAFT_59325 [Gonapodya prolifera JEL478]|eukprot:KXS12583.1 hypothetical protein M427DRAFT_59325 [Gonapodya prolifera JEL478]